MMEFDVAGAEVVADDVVVSVCVHAERANARMATEGGALFQTFRAALLKRDRDRRARVIAVADTARLRIVDKDAS